MPKRVGKIAAAMAFLRTYMHPGASYDAGKLIDAALAAGHARRTVQLASERLHIEKAYRRIDGAVTWEWVIPAAEVLV